MNLDVKGFVRTGAGQSKDELTAARWPLLRRPYVMETSLPGVFAVGDVRSGSVKRVASGVGEGSICVQFVHQALRELPAVGGWRLEPVVVEADADALAGDRVAPTPRQLRQLSNSTTHPLRRAPPAFMLDSPDSHRRR